MSPAEEPENKFCGEKNQRVLSKSCLYDLFQEKENGDIHAAPYLRDPMRKNSFRHVPSSLCSEIFGNMCGLLTAHFELWITETAVDLVCTMPQDAVKMCPRRPKMGPRWRPEGSKDPQKVL